MQNMRLDKFLVEAGIGSRTEVKKLLKQKQVQVNGKVETSPKVHIVEAADDITCQGQHLSYEKFVYYLLNKPKGVISATEDNYHKTVLDLLDKKAHDKEVFPVGRLDIDTHGLLLLTNNGNLAHAMLSPKKHVTKIYQAQVEGIMTEEDVDAFRKGIVLEDFTCEPARLSILEKDQDNQICHVEITIKEGKFHQVKRMVQSCGKHVRDLQRVSMGPLVLDEQLKIGSWRPLTKEEWLNLKSFGVEL